ncbi:MAG: aminoacyl-tRNA hydrolase [Gammaproteobacteria bacterium RIFCSPHIGHO2_12_FULL_42_10]|nr:MAG: aminoacyl-tRNA hydrolase [Gammaproteobacteria bacterium RIFCSPHIGHO2_12_FULL_42_10]
MIKLIVGLANPGEQYQKTRHNAGAWFIELIAETAHASLKKNTKYHGLHSTITLHQAICHLLIPTTFMNLSGRSLSAIMNYTSMTPNMILIAHDDIDLPVGTIRLKLEGGDGGHNGLKDIINHLHTKQFYRLRIGVGRPPHQTEQDIADYVLNPPSKRERAMISHALLKAYDILPYLMQGKIQKAMHLLHTTNASD